MKKMTFFLNFISYHIFAIYIYMGGASLGLPTAFRLIAVSGARLPSADGLAVRCIKMHHHVKSAITICLQFISNMFTIYTCIPTHRDSAPVFYLQKAPSWGIYVDWINFNPAWISNYLDYKVWDKLLIYSQTSMVAPLKFGNGISNFK